MFLRFENGEKWYTTVINWTDDKGNSKVFENIHQYVAAQTGLDVALYTSLATELDELVDKLYENIYIITNEYSAAPYDSNMARRLMMAAADLRIHVEIIALDAEDPALLLLVQLYRSVLDKLQETTDIFLEETRYRSKYRTRKRRKEQSVEVTDERLLSYEFEDMLLTMTDLSHMLECLTPTQRERLVKHVFLRYTTQEIANAENVTRQGVEKSIAGALTKLKSRLSQ